MRKFLLKYTNGRSEVHLENPLQMGDYAICGQDLSGDESLGWHQGVVTCENITCTDCLAIIKACKEFTV